MSEPTGGNQGPDPDHAKNQDQDEGQDQIQDQVSGSVFSDPTAPVWADPTTPMPTSEPESEAAAMAVPPAPPVAPQPQGEDPAAASPPATPSSNPYAQQPPSPYAQQAPAQPYAQPQPGQQYPAYGQPQPGQPTDPYGQYGQPQTGVQYPAYAQQPYATGPAAETNASAIVLTILSGILMLSTCFVIGIPSLIFGIMALTSNNADPVGSRKKTKTGWILFAVNVGVVALLAVIGFALLVTYGNNTSNSSFGY